MIAVSKSLGATVANGALSLAVQDTNGLLTDVYAASVQILDSAGATVLAKTPLDVEDVNKVGTGRYAAAWAPGVATVGQYSVRWYYQLTDTSDELSFDQEFELVATPYASTPYCAVYDIRAEGVTTGMANDAKVQGWIARAGKYIEHFTQQTFAPAFKTLALDGRESRVLFLGEPIIALGDIAIDYFTVFGANSLVIPGETLRVFNRHMRGMLSPDDRLNPKLEFVHGNDLGGVNFSGETNAAYSLGQLIWPRGVKNVQVTGLFGFTEPDGSFVGATPFMIREAAKLFVVRMMPQMADASARAEASQRDRIIMETTRDQSVQYATPWLKGALTGSYEIDSILYQYSRPPMFGAA